MCIITLSDIGPALIADTLQLVKNLSESSSVDIGSDLTSTLSQWQSFSDQVRDLIGIFSSDMNESSEIFAKLWHVSGVFLQIVFGYIVSYVWILEHEKVHTYFSHMRTGPFRFLYDDFRDVFHRVTQSFGLVFRAQGKIALVNTLLTAL